MIRLLIASHHITLQIRILPFREGFSDINIIDSADNITQLFELCAQGVFDILILDVNLLDRSLNEVVVRIKQTQPHIRILLIISQSDPADLRNLVPNYVEGCIYQSEYLQNIENAVRTLWLGGFWFNKSVLLYLFQLCHTLPYKDIANLTQRELEVLKLLSKGLTNKEIAEALGIKERTIEFHVSNILEKLHLTSRVTAALWANSLPGFFVV